MTKIQLSIIESEVLSLIPRGSERKTSLTEIGKSIDLDIRSIQATINSLIKKGIPCVAVRSLTNGGLFIAETDEEREIGLKSLERQALDMQRRAELVRQADLVNWPETVLPSYQERLEV